jgi:epoxyqueuosine reductase QueG
MQEHQQRFICDGCDRVSPWHQYNDPPEHWKMVGRNGRIWIEVKNQMGTPIVLCDDCAGPIVTAFERRGDA